MHTNSPPLIVHVIHHFGVGGMENGIVNLINHMPPGRYRHAIVCLTGYSELPVWKKLIVAPSRLQNFMIEMIDREAEFEKAGKGGRIVAKLNGVLEPAVVQALYRASQAGVKIDLVCRGICALWPFLSGRRRVCGWCARKGNR